MPTIIDEKGRIKIFKFKINIIDLLIMSILLFLLPVAYFAIIVRNKEVKYRKEWKQKAPLSLTQKVQYLELYLFKNQEIEYEGKKYKLPKQEGVEGEDGNYYKIKGKWIHKSLID